MNQIYDFNSYSQSTFISGNQNKKKIVFDGKTTIIEGYEQIDIIKYLLDELSEVKKELINTKKKQIIQESLTSFEKDWESKSDAIWNKI